MLWAYTIYSASLTPVVLAMVVVSLFTPKPAPEQLAQFAD
jgi:hypothetical protein